VKLKTILSTCVGCAALLAFAWLLSQVHQLKVEARELASELERGRQVPLTVGAPVGGVPSVTTVQRVVQLQPQEPIEIADIMTKLQRHMNKLYFAGEHKNWDLTAFYLEELEETVKGVANKNIMEGQVNISGLMQGLLVGEIETMEEKLQDQTVESFRPQYLALVKACNLCHEATKHSYIRIIQPRTPIFDNQDYNPVVVTNSTAAL